MLKGLTLLHGKKSEAATQKGPRFVEEHDDCTCCPAWHVMMTCAYA